MGITGGAWAQVYKCQGSDGRVNYTSAPCERTPGQKSMGEVRAPGAPASPRPALSPEEEAVLRAQAPNMVPYCRSLQDEVGRIRREIATLEAPPSFRSEETQERRALELERRRIEVRKLRFKLEDVQKDAEGRSCTAHGVLLEGAAARADVHRRHCLSLYTSLELARYRQGKGFADGSELVREATGKLDREHCSLNAADYPKIVLPVQ